MAKIIIGIHGLSNKPRYELIEKWWMQSIEDGLRKYFPDGYPDFRFELVYWADVLYDSPNDESVTDPDDPLYLREPYAPDVETQEYEDHPVKQKIRDAIVEQLNKIFLNDDYTLNFSELNDFIIRNGFKDLEAYFTNKLNSKNILVKDELRKRLVDRLIKYRNDEILLIGHSMGTIISYDVLSLYSSKVKVNTFMTVGSPLGLPVVISKTAREQGLNNAKKQKLRTPDSIIKNWYNFSDMADKVAFNDTLHDDILKNRKGVGITDFIVENNYSYNGGKNPHKVYGYLRTPEFTAKVFEFLTEKKVSILKGFWYKIKYKTIRLKIKES